MSPVGEDPRGLFVLYDPFVTGSPASRPAVRESGSLGTSQLPCLRCLRPAMIRCLTVLLLLAFALSCGGPGDSAERPNAGESATSSSSVVPAETPPPTATPAASPNAPLRGGAVGLADGRNAPVVRVVPRDLISAVFDPVHIPAAQVGERVGTASSIIGVSIGGESVAYSVSYLSGREIVNDNVGGTPIAVTW